mmetsp:Transcript_60345/g.156631  ORF Transcript_60345/g.156631 Transcript_60345/m.156631 type:complete len:291 (+) Transcript_60345:139-1011(+)
MGSTTAHSPVRVSLARCHRGQCPSPHPWALPYTMRMIMPRISTTVQASAQPMKNASGSPYSRNARDPMSTEIEWPASRTGCATAMPKGDRPATVVVTLTHPSMAPCASARCRMRRASQRPRTSPDGVSEGSSADSGFAPAAASTSRPSATRVTPPWASSTPRPWAQTKEMPCWLAGCSLLMGKQLPPATPASAVQVRPRTTLPMPASASSASAALAAVRAGVGSVRTREARSTESEQVPNSSRTRPSRAMPKSAEGSPKYSFPHRKDVSVAIDATSMSVQMMPTSMIALI